MFSLHQLSCGYVVLYLEGASVREIADFWLVDLVGSNRLVCHSNRDLDFLVAIKIHARDPPATLGNLASRALINAEFYSCERPPEQSQE
jgi:hypothetical protein